MDVLEPFAAAGAVLALLGITLWWLGRRGYAARLPVGGAANRRLERLERLVLAPQHSLHLVRFEDRTLLVAATPAGCKLIATAPWRAAVGTEGGR